MTHPASSIRPFLGAQDYAISRRFYRALGFEETELFPNMCLFEVNDQLAFYLQNAYVKDWVDNAMVFLEVPDVDAYQARLAALRLPEQFAGVRLSAVRVEGWGKVCFLHDPSGILWQIGQFT